MICDYGTHVSTHIKHKPLLGIALLEIMPPFWLQFRDLISLELYHFSVW